MARSWKFHPSDLMVDMPKPTGYDDFPGQEKPAAKQGKQSTVQQSTLPLCLSNTDSPAMQTTFETDLVLKTSSCAASRTKPKISQLPTQSKSTPPTPPLKSPTGQCWKSRSRRD